MQESLSQMKLIQWLGGESVKIGALDIPVSVILIVAVAVVAYIILNKLSYGRKLYAVGGNRIAAICSGINAKRVIMSSYMICGLFMGISAIIWGGRTLSAVPLQGDGLEFNVLTAVILGGVSLAGGSGTLKGTLIGAAIFGLISTAIGMIDTPPYVIYWIQGGIIVVAVYLDIRMSTTEAKKTKDVKTDEPSKEDALNAEALKLVHSGEQQVLELRTYQQGISGR